MWVCWCGCLDVGVFVRACRCDGWCGCVGVTGAADLLM
jgi:hypothetical protein